MTEQKGHFEKGVWVEATEAPLKEEKKEESQIDLRLQAATRGVISAMDELAKATHDLVATEEGQKHIEKKVKDTTTEIQKSFDDIVGHIREHARTKKEKAVEMSKKIRP